MAEQTAQEKLEELHKFQVELLERRIKEMEEQHHLSLEREREDRQEQRKAAAELFHDRQQELTKQNDGMLGAIGRLHGENESLRKQVQDLDLKLKEKAEHVNRLEHDFEIMRHQLEIESQRRMEKTKDDLDRAREENLELRKRLGEKIPDAADIFKSFAKAGKKGKKGKK